MRLFFAIILFLLVNGCSINSPLIKPAVIDDTNIKSVKFTFLKSFGMFGQKRAEFTTPKDAAIDDKRIYVADTGNHRIEIFDADGDFISEMGMFGSDAGKYSRPCGIKIEASRFMYVLEKDNNRVQKLDVRDVPVRSFGKQGFLDGEMNYPEGFCIDDFGNIFIADTGNDRIQKFDNTGTFLMKFGNYGYGEGFMSKPADVAVDIQANIYVLDSGNNRVEKFNASGDFMLAFGADAGLKNPRNIEFDRYNKVLFVSDSGNNRIIAFSLNGAMLGSFSGEGAQKLNLPAGLSVSADSLLCIADSANHRIVLLRADYVK